MNRTEKEAFVEDFKERVERAPAFFLADFTGLDVKSVTTLRADVKKNGGEFLVAKNRLIRRALEGTDVPDLGEALTGPTGVIFGYEGAVEPAKAVTDFAKEHEDRPVFKLGVLENEILTPQEIDRLAKLPSKEALLAQLAGAFEAPMAALASALGAKLQEMAGLLDALKLERE